MTSLGVIISLRNTDKTPIAVPSFEGMCLLPGKILISWPLLTPFMMILETLLLTKSLVAPSTRQPALSVLQSMLIQFGQCEISIPTNMTLMLFTAVFMKAHVHLQSKSIAHCLTAHFILISFLPAVITPDVGFQLLSVLQGLVAEFANMGARDDMRHYSFNPLLFVHFAGINSKTSQHIYLLIMTLLEFVFKALDDRRLQLRMRLGLRLCLCGRNTWWKNVTS